MNPERFSLSESDGHLYRNDNWSAPLRKNVMKWHPQIRTVAELKATIRAADRAFGGTDLVMFTDDGGTLCSECVKKELSRIMDAIRDKSSNGWRVTSASMDNDLDPCSCDNCDAVIVPDPDDAETDGGYDGSDDFIDSDPWRGGPEGDMYG